MLISYSIVFFPALLPDFAAPPVQFTNPVRLYINGSLTTGNRGTVQIWYNGTWGSVCDDFWGFSNALVVCRMLGYTNAIQAYTSAYFGQLTGPIHLDNVQCTGQERELGDCQHLPWGLHNCVHGEDAGVACTSECPYMVCCLWCPYMVCACGVLIWCVPVVSLYGVCLWCPYMVCACGVLIWCVPVVSLYGVCLWCPYMVCACGVLIWCVPVVSLYGVCLWCPYMV